MFISAKKKIVLSAICLALMGLCAAPSAARADEALAALKKQLEIGEAAEALLATRRDAELKTIFKSGLSQKEITIKAEAVLETYRVESSKLVAQYRQPLIEHLQQKFPGVQDSVGTPLYARDERGNIRQDAQGRKIIHSDFRGWRGDHDMQGSAADVERVRKYLNDGGFDTTGFGSKDLGDLTPGDLSNKRLELTVNLDPTNQSIQKQLQNPDLTPEVRQQLETQLARSKKSDSMLKAGDSAHQAVANVAAQGKETYVAVSMQNGQPGVKAVLVNDHYKKAVEGLGLDGDALLSVDNRDALQGKIKGTEKALHDSGLAPDTIDATLKKHQMDMSAAEYRDLMKKLKVKPYPQIYGLDAAKMENLRKVNQDLIDQSVSKTLKDAVTEIDSHRKKIVDLNEQIKQTSDPAEKQKLTSQREKLGSEVVDTRVKLQAVLAANDERRLKYGLPPRPPVAEADALKLTPETAPSGKHAELKAKSNRKQAASNAVNRAGTALGLFGFYSIAMARAEEVVAESSPSDSDIALIIEATKRGTMDSIGLNDAVEIMEGEMDLISSAMKNMDKGNYFTAFLEWNTAMVKSAGKLGWKMFEDSIVTPVSDTAVAVYEGGKALHDMAQDEATIARNEAEQKAQQEAIARMKAERETPPTAPEVAASGELTREDVYRLVPADTIMAYADRVALAKEIQAQGDMQAERETAQPPESEPVPETPAITLTQGGAAISVVDENGDPMRSSYYQDSAFSGYLVPPSGLQPPLQWSATSAPGGLADVTVNSRDFLGNDWNNAARGWRAYMLMQPRQTGSGAVQVQVTDSAGKTVSANLPIVIDESAEALEKRIGMASKDGDWDTVRRGMADYPDIMRHCLAGGTAHNASARHCASGGVRLASIVLVNASVQSDAALVRELIAAGADPNAKASDGTSVLMLAIGAGHGGVTDALLGAGADPNIVWRDGITPLHIAAMRGDTALAEKLMAAGARPVADAEGHTPGYYLYWGGNKDAALASRLGYNEGFDYEARAQAEAQSNEDWNLFAQAMLQGLAGAVQEYQSYQSAMSSSSGMPSIDSFASEQPDDWDDFMPAPGNAYVSPPAQTSHAAETSTTVQRNEVLKKCVHYTFAATYGSTSVYTLNETPRCISLLTLKPIDIPDPITVCGKTYYIGGKYWKWPDKQKIYERALRDKENYRIKKDLSLFAECAPHPF